MSTKKPDYYTVLGVNRAASIEEIKKAYRQKAFEYHPDRNPGDVESEEQFKAAADAYDVLSDPQKRQMYDTYGHAGLSGTGFHHYADTEEIFSHFADIFEDFFGFTGGLGSRGRRRQRNHGVDLAYNLQIDFEEAVFGTEKEISFAKRASCDTCDGSGAAAGSHPETCPQCGGQGQVRVSQGFFSLQSTCPQCHGEGQVISKPCDTCRGVGLVNKEKAVKVKVPAGVDNATRLVLRGEGEAGVPGGRQGDLYVNVHVRLHPLFWRQEHELHAELELSMVQASLGCHVEVETLEGPHKVTVAKGTQTGDTVRLKRLGVPHVQSSRRGDLILHVYVSTPQKIVACTDKTS